MTQTTNTKKRGRPKDQEKSAAIIAVATRLFIEKGMSRTTMQAIANQAGVSKYTVYNHFETKAALFQQVIQNKCVVHMGNDLFERALSQSPQEGLFTLGMGFIGIIYNDEAIAMHRTIMGESRHDSDIAHLFYQSGPARVINAIELYLKHLEEQGVCQFANRQRAAEVFLGLFTGATHTKTVLKVTPKPSDACMAAFARENVAFFLRIFGVK